MIGILPTLRRRPHDRGRASAPTRATSCSASRSSTPAARTSRSRSPASATSSGSTRPPTRSCPRRRAPAPSSTCRPRPTASRSTGTPPRRSPRSSWRSCANSPYLLGKELWRETRIPLFEQATDTRSDELKAQGVRPRVWFGERWITSVFDLFEENVRYFPALLPDHRRRGPARGARGRRHARARRAAAAQRHDLPLEPAGLRHRRGSAAPARREPHPRRRPHRRRHRRQRRLLLRAGARRWPRASGRCGRRCRSAPPRRTSTWPPSTASTRRSTGPASGRCGATELTLRRLLPLAREGLADWGVEQRDQRPAARDHRAALPDRDQRRRVVRATGCASAPTWTGSTRCGRRCWSTASGCTPTSRSTPGTGGAARPGALHPGPAQPAARVAPAVPVDHHERQRRPGLGVRRAGGGQPPQRRRPAARARRSGSARPARSGRGAGARTRSAATMSVRSPGSVGSAAPTDSEAHAAAGDADVQDRRVDPAPLAGSRGRAPPGAAARGVPRQGFAQPVHAVTSPDPGRSTPGSPQAVLAAAVR